MATLEFDRDEIDSLIYMINQVQGGHTAPGIFTALFGGREIGPYPDPIRIKSAREKLIIASRRALQQYWEERNKAIDVAEAAAVEEYYAETKNYDEEIFKAKRAEARARVTLLYPE